MSAQPSERILAKMIEARQAERENHMVRLAEYSDGNLRSEAERHGVELIIGETRASLIQRVADKRYPDLGSMLLGPEVSLAQEQALMHGLSVAANNYEAGASVARDFVMAQRAEPGEFPHMSGASVKPRLVEVQPEGDGLHVPADTPNQFGGVDTLDVIEMGKKVVGEQDRFFVAFRDNGRPVRFDIKEIITMNGLDADSRTERRVVIVDLPSWWIMADYVQEAVDQLEAAALTGEPENVLAVIQRLRQEQGFQPPQEIGGVHGYEEDPDATQTNLPAVTGIEPHPEPRNQVGPFETN